jgi:hypothetical protein
MPVTYENHDKVLKAIDPPKDWKLVASDGREYAIKSYSPTVSCDSVVTIKIEAIVYLPETEEST